MIQPIREAMNESDLIIFTAPVYVYHIPGQLKAFLDHFACEWVVHRPNPNMFHKQALIITTACGAGMSKTVKDIKDSLDYWCVGRVYTYKKGIFQGHWDEINPEVQESMKKKVLKIADKIKKREGRGHALRYPHPGEHCHQISQRLRAVNLYSLGGALPRRLNKAIFRRKKECITSCLPSSSALPLTSLVK